MEGDAELRELLSRVRSIAVVGIKVGERDDAYRVPRYLQDQGFRIIPVTPKLEFALGERAYRSLSEVPEPVDLVNLFSAPANVQGHADEILRRSPLPAAVWMQLGIRHEPSAERLEAAGIDVVQDRCLMVEHQRLLGSHSRVR